MKNLYLKTILILAILLIAIAGIFFLVTKKSKVQALPTGETATLSIQLDDGANGEQVPNADWKPADISKVPILTYHSFGPKPDTKESRITLQYRVTVSAFEDHMKYLSEKGYHTITFADLVENQISGKPLPENPIVLTFDDGWKTQYEYAVPILEKYHFTATFFIITKMTGMKAYMTLDELKDLNAKGFEIASHTKTHQKLPTLDDAKLLDEIKGSKDILEERLGITIKTLAYPYYVHDERVMKAVKDAGYIGARAGWGSYKNDATHLFDMMSQESVNNPNPFASKRLAD